MFPPPRHPLARFPTAIALLAAPALARASDARADLTAHWAGYAAIAVFARACVGGSLLAIGSAAGVALMAQARGQYTCFSHLRWTWAIARGYAASIAVHFAANARYFWR